MRRFDKVVATTAAVLLMFTGLEVSSVDAQSTNTIEISAYIGTQPEVSMSICDTSADFGSGLTNEGAEPVSTDPQVFATSKGTLPEGGSAVFYVWGSACEPTLAVTSTIPFVASTCASQNLLPGSSPDVLVSQFDLRVYPTSAGAAAPLNYDFWLSSVPGMTGDCGNPYPLFSSTDPGFISTNLFLALRVEENDREGFFQANLVVSAQPL